MYNNIKLISDEQVKNIQSLTIKCYSDEEFAELKKLLKTNKKSLDYEDIRGYLIENLVDK